MRRSRSRGGALRPRAMRRPAGSPRTAQLLHCCCNEMGGCGCESQRPRAHHRMQLQNAMSAITRAVDAKVGWNRIGIAISLLIIAIAFATLFRLLRDVDFGKVVLALQATPPHTVLIASVFVAA